MDPEEREGPLDGVGGYPRDRLSISLASIPPRVSVEDHFRRQSLVMGVGRVALPPNCTAHVEQDETKPLDIPPPPYDAIVPILIPSPPRRKFNVQPREDEGQEALPPYSCAISLENVFLRKMELEGAVHRAHDRNWYPVAVTLQGTALTFHKTKSGNVFSKIDGSKAAAKRGGEIKSYNLQHADVGVAADYTKKRFVIRVRAEADQFLIACPKIEPFVLWLQALFAAIDLAAPLDDRDLPSDLSVPQPRRRRGDRTRDGNNFRSAGQGQEGQDVMGEDGSPLGSSDTGEESEGGDLVLVTASLLTPRADSPQTRPRSRSGRTPPRLLQTHGPNLRSRRHNSSSTTNPSINPETGKWMPKHQWTPFSDMLYAKRCMAILTSESPRKTNLLIMKGTRWVINWETGMLRKWTPEPEFGLPDYDEEERDEEREEIWRISQFGELARV